MLLAVSCKRENVTLIAENGRCLGPVEDGLVGVSLSVSEIQALFKHLPCHTWLWILDRSLYSNINIGAFQLMKAFYAQAVFPSFHLRLGKLAQ